VIASRLRALFLMGLCWAVLWVVPAPAQAADAIGIRAAQLQRSASVAGWVLSADITLDLPEYLREAVNRGVALPFTMDFELLRPRWYWLDERTVEASRTYRVSFHALTREYRVTLEGASRSFDTLTEALAAFAKMRDWRVMDIGLMQPGIQYEPRIRVRLDTSLLTKPFQVNAITSRDWNLKSEWTPVRFNP
jgi:hypothetical protein